MTKAKSSKQIIKLLGCDKISLHAGKDYWYFIYDDLDVNCIFEEVSIFTCRLSDMSLERWLEAGQQLIDNCKIKYQNK